jgi:hypothetical protein
LIAPIPLPDILKGAFMNILRIAIAALGGFVAYIVTGAVIFRKLPFFKNEFLEFPSLNRCFGVVVMYLSMVSLAVLYSMLYQGGSVLTAGTHFGLLISFFAICSFFLHSYVNQHTESRLTFPSAFAYLVEWTAVGIAIAFTYSATVPN